EYSFQIIPEETGDIVGEVIIEGDEGVYDNVRYFSIHIPPKRSVLLINNESGGHNFHSYLASVLQSAQMANSQLTFVKKSVAEVDQSMWHEFDVIALDGLEQVPEYWFQELQRYVQNGNGVLFLP